MTLLFGGLALVGFAFLAWYLAMERRPDPDMNGLIPGMLALLILGADVLLLLGYALWRLLT